MEGPTYKGVPQVNDHNDQWYQFYFGDAQMPQFAGGDRDDSNPAWVQWGKDMQTWRERVSQAVQAANIAQDRLNRQYAAENKTTLATHSEWGHPTADPKRYPNKPNKMSAGEAVARVVWTQLHPDKPYPGGAVTHHNVTSDPVNDPYNEPTNTPGPVKGGKRWSRPSGDYFPTQTGTDGRPTGVPNPIAEDVPFAKQSPYEQAGYGPIPAPYGYTESGRPRQFPGQVDSKENSGMAVSEYAPNKKYGPTVNKDKQTTKTGTGTGGGGKTKRI